MKYYVYYNNIMMTSVSAYELIWMDLRYLYIIVCIKML